MTTKQWWIEVGISEDGDLTRAEAVLTTKNHRFEATGTARRNPRDESVPEIGDELATTRALAELAHQILEATAADIEKITSQPAHLER